MKVEGKMDLGEGVRSETEEGRRSKLYMPTGLE